MAKGYKPYAEADRTQRRLHELIVKEYKAYYAAIMAFDEINAPKIKKRTTELYSRLQLHNRLAYRELAGRVYGDFWEDLILLYLAEKDDEMAAKAREMKRKSKLPDAKWVKAKLGEISPVSRYEYVAETKRKEARLMENVAASLIFGGERTARQETKTAQKYWARQTDWYTDLIEDEARLKAMRDAGIERVRWISQQDERVCEDCDELDGKVFSIDKIPPKPHLGCRCYLEPVI